MRPVRSGFEFRMSLSSDKPRVSRNFDHLDDTAVRGKTAQRHAVLLQYFAVIVVYFITVAVAFADLVCTVQLLCQRAFFEYTRISAKAECSADILDTDLIRHDMDDRMSGIGFQLHTVGVIISDDVSGKFHNSKLHAQTQPEKGDIMSAGILYGSDFTLNPSVTEAAGNKDTAYIREEFIHVVCGYCLGINPFDIYSSVRVDTAVL